MTGREAGSSPHYHPARAHTSERNRARSSAPSEIDRAARLVGVGDSLGVLALLR